MNLVQQTPPQSWSDVLLLPGLALFFGALVLGMAIRSEALGKRSTAKWLALAILLVGLWMGLPWFISYVGPWPEAKLYQADLVVQGRRMLWAHWGAVVLPMIGVIAFVVYQATFSRRLLAKAMSRNS